MIQTKLFLDLAKLLNTSANPFFSWKNIYPKRKRVTFKKGDVWTVRNSWFLWVTMIAYKITGLLYSIAFLLTRVNLPRKINTPLPHTFSISWKKIHSPNCTRLRDASLYITGRENCRTIPEGGPTDNNKEIWISPSYG